MAKFWRKQLLTGKIETTYGVDPTPTAADNAIEASEVSVNALEGTDLERAILLPYLGARASQPAGTYSTMTFDVDWQGAGAAGDVPAYDPLLRACGMATTETEVTDVVWDPVSDADTHEAVTIKWNADGNQHVLRGARGTFQLVFVGQQYAKLRFTFTGLYSTPSAVALTDPDLSAWIAPLKISAAVTTFSLFGASRVLHRFEVNAGLVVAARHLVNQEDVIIDDRVAMATAVIDAVAVSSFNPWALAHPDSNGDPQTGVVTLTHGTVAGRKVSVTAGKVQILRNIALGQANGRTTWSLPLKLLPTTGDDDFQMKAF